jgi:hypothetical protein
MRILTIPVFLISVFNCQAQISAVTSTGEEVVLYNNGTWKYISKNDSAKEITLSSSKFSKSSQSTFQVKSNILKNVSIYINSKTWSFEKLEENNAREYQFQLKGKDAYGMLITERIGIPIEALRESALKNAKNAAPDIELVKEEFRMVNGVKVLFMQMNGTLQGISFSYYGYYYSSRSGSMQLITYTSENLLNEYKQSLEELLNGLSIIEEK